MEKRFFSAMAIATGIALAGMFVYFGFNKTANKDRVVNVKGLSTREVVADYVVWPLEFAVSGNDLSDLQYQLKSVEETARRFFIKKGFKSEDMSLGNTQVEDNWVNYYDHRPDNHYTLRTSLIISTEDVMRVQQNQGCQSELLSKGVILNSYGWNTDYQYNGLNELKPIMIEEATKNARAVAQKFADDAECKLGSIRYANQGQFSIESDEHQPWKKHVRVVTTIGYMLE